MLETFGAAGTPAVQFDVRLRYGYACRVVVWETRELLRRAAKLAPLRKKHYAGVTDPRGCDGRRVAILHLCIRTLTIEGPETLVHELSHVMDELRERIRKHYRTTFTLNEAMAQECESAFAAITSHIAEEQRLGHL